MRLKLFFLAALFCVPARGGPIVCRSSATVESVVAAYGKSWSLADWPRSDGPFLTDPLTSYYVCSSLVAGDSGSCAELEKMDRKPSADPNRRDKTLAQTCRMEFDEDRMAKAFIAGDADAQKFCEIDLRQLRGKPLFKPGRLGPACADFAKNWDKPALACEHMRREFAGSPKDAGMDPCEVEIGVFSGERSACAAGDFPDRIRHCLDFAAFRTARGAADPKLCGESGICRALMGQGLRACRGYADKIRSAFCSRP